MNVGSFSTETNKIYRQTYLIISRAKDQQTLKISQ